MTVTPLSDAAILEELFGENDVRQAISKSDRPILFLAEAKNLVQIEALLKRRSLADHAKIAAYDAQDSYAETVLTYYRIVLAPAAEETVLVAVRARGAKDVLGFYEDFYPKAVCFNWGRVAQPVTPKRAYAIVSTPRSGSTLLSELMWNNDVGRPKEHFRQPLISALAAAEPKKRYLEFVEQVIQNATFKGVFGTKIISHFAEGVAELVGTTVPLNTIDAFEDFRIIFLLRENKVEQGLSGYVARQSNTFHLRDKKQLEKHQQAEIPYNFELIEERYNWMVTSERRLVSTVHALVNRPGHRKLPLAVCVYEQLEADMAGEVSKIMKFMDEDVANPKIDVRIQKLANSQTKELADRFIQEYTATYGRAPETSFREYDTLLG